MHVACGAGGVTKSSQGMAGSPYSWDFGVDVRVPDIRAGISLHAPRRIRDQSPCVVSSSHIGGGTRLVHSATFRHVYINWHWNLLVHHTLFQIQKDFGQ